MLHPYDGSGTKIYDDKNGVILWVMNYAGVDGDDDENLGVVVYAVNISEDTVTFVPQNTVINKEEADEFLVHGNEITLLPGTRTLTYLDWDMDGIEFAEVEFAVNYENNPANNTVTKHYKFAFNADLIISDVTTPSPH